MTNSTQLFAASKQFLAVVSLHPSFQCKFLMLYQRKQALMFARPSGKHLTINWPNWGQHSSHPQGNLPSVEFWSWDVVCALRCRTVTRVPTSNHLCLTRKFVTLHYWRLLYCRHHGHRLPHHQTTTTQHCRACQSLSLALLGPPCFKRRKQNGCHNRRI